MTPTAYKIANLKVQEGELAEQKRHNTASEAEEHRRSTLNFVSNLLGAGLSAAGSAGGKLGAAAIGAASRKGDSNAFKMLEQEFNQLVAQRKVGKLPDDKFARLQELAKSLRRKY